jgi:hypothetical protein
MVFIRAAGDTIESSAVTRYSARSKFETDKPILEETYRRQAIFAIPKFMILLNGLASSIQSIMGATETLRSNFPRETPSEMPIFIGFSDSGASAGFLGIAGSLRIREVT